ncbi:kinesin family protein [Talaromyces stipitatus ATCC 10500]|uniref:Kinesin family protein n=1 Tax=Talaromyces stipitatus (strain ATCC 10500 / CBS 375.48 / QM 6759 / NRRL 1006) TaxID=441959 RepID=B8MRI0_TALSN|nr:kinesin family protein [Talaromyces stipitatus ATCC 10500]EED13117.1 kinesin family protein [Talaromyces stipitatus ATCC 10500]
MTASPPGSPTGPTPTARPMSAVIRPPRSMSRMSVGSRPGGSRASDEESKTAVKVVVRVRPPLKETDPGYDLIPQRFRRSMVHVTSQTSLAVDVTQGRKLFVFDRVFPETTDQEGIWEYLSDSVNSFTQGYNVSILAYGQSGAGKSYTMGTSSPGDQIDARAMGIIPRAAQLLFEKLDGPRHSRTQSSGLRTPARYSMSSPQSFNRSPAEKTWQMKATYVEIYNEQLRDLLVPEATPVGDRSNVTIREDTKGRIILTGLHQVDINSFEDLMGALNFGSSIRQTDATAINAKSSRSHAVFSLNLIQRKSSAQTMSAREKRMSVPVEALSSSDAVVTVDSKLHFVDLAGSERLKNTGASGERAKEGISINAGLASLGKVISQLSSRQSGAHVSYRDSKLTRLLQDSLGGTAITYMVACVTPAEFHLSETLNTVQYAQRARAIQSKPRIQQTTDESDKQATIERLKAEVAFLRQQIRNSENGDRKSVVQPERSDRSTDREMELQNHLLDMQESYNSLSERHAKLISELSKASDLQTENPNELAAAIENSSVERLKRSHSFAKSVEQVVLEYEKTIQSLESSLSSTRASLAATESSLLERESKCAYLETHNAQLQTRVQKLMDRENSTEHYLHDLESKLDGHFTGEEKNSALVYELRKELTRAHENEAGCEDYISTLEERLAEADQDMELMQREIHRLEHVIDRQRNLGKLDNLLYELDHIQQNGSKSQAKPRTNRTRGNTLDILTEAVETAIPEDDDEDLGEDTATNVVSEEIRDLDNFSVEDNVETAEEALKDEEMVEDHKQSPAQSKSCREWQIQHEMTQNEYDLLAAKYEEALRAMAEMQDQIDFSRHPAGPLNINTPVDKSVKTEEAKTGGQHSSSRSLSSELSSVEQSGISQDTFDTTVMSAPSMDNGPLQSEEEIKTLRQLLREHEEGMNLVAQKYAQLEAEHDDTLILVEQLKTDLQKARMPQSPTTPSPGGASVIRRMTSQNLMSTVDRAHRSLAALRNIASEEFEERPDAMQNFEQNLNAAMHELHIRIERIQALEAENANVKKEMEMKATIISGLTRERSSLQGAKPMDMAMVSQMRDQIFQQENQMREMQEAHESREQELRSEIEKLRAELSSHTKTDASETPATNSSVLSEESQVRLAQLETELSEWKGRHQVAIESLEASEQKLRATAAELSEALASVDALRAEHADSLASLANEKAVLLREREEERKQQESYVAALQSQIDGHQFSISTHLATIAELEASHSAIQDQLTHYISTKEANDANSAVYQSRIAELEDQLESHRAHVADHDKELASLRQTHQEQLSELQSRSTAVDSTKSDHDSLMAQLNAQHEENLAALRSEIASSKQDLTGLLNAISRVLETQVTPVTVGDQLEDLISEKRSLESKYADLIDAHEDLQRQLEYKDASVEEPKTSNEEHESRITELATLVATLEDKLKEKEELVQKKDATIEEITAEKQKSVRLVEELEEQITNTFDQHHNRLSVMQNERLQALEEANAKVANLEREVETYQVRIEQLELQLKNSGTEVVPMDRTNSLSSVRKSASTTSLPSPPPAIPLPPLPNIASATAGNTNSMSPPSSRHTSRELVSTQLMEDQEARIKTIEKHLYAEKQLTATLEEALGDLEAQSNKIKADMEAWKKKAWQYEDELQTLRKERNSTRLSLQAVEEERSARREAEAARAQLEERMNAINRKKKKSTLNCF